MSSPHPPEQLVQSNHPHPHHDPPLDGAGDDGGDSTPPTKKRKIVAAKTPQERAEEKAKREEEKNAREEDKTRKDEEKRKREEERIDERRKREEKKKVKLDEKLAKEEERKKKEKSQMRLNAFFMKPTVASAATNSPEAAAVPEEESNDEPKQSTSDYEKEFPPFFVHPHMTVAPANRFCLDSESSKYACEKIDQALENITTPIITFSPPTPPPPPTSNDPASSATKPKRIFNMLPYKRRRGCHRYPCAKELVMSMQDPSSNTVDLTAVSRQLQEALKQIPMKILQFAEDVRPPYKGTFSRRIPPRDAVRLCRNPFARALPQCDYDYDSEAEWEEPEEGEDLDSEDGDEEVDDEDDDMDGFLDDRDEDVPTGKRKIMVDSLEPVCTGLKFGDDEQDGVDPVLENHRLEIIGDEIQFPIDPFSTAYWEKPKPISRINPDEANAANTLPPNVLSSPVALPSSPSGHRLLSHFGQLNVASESSPMKPTMTKPNPPGFPDELLPDFKKVIQDNNLTKTGLIEVLKKQFPQLPKTLIKDTLNVTAVRHGQREADKKWVLLDESNDTNLSRPTDVPLIE